MEYPNMALCLHLNDNKRAAMFKRTLKYMEDHVLKISERIQDTNSVQDNDYFLWNEGFIDSCNSIIIREVG